METGMCFVVVESDFDRVKLEVIKKILDKHGYYPNIATETSSFNVDFLEHKILRPMKTSDFVIVILSPKSKKDSNFNIAFEYGLARGIPVPVVLLFNARYEELPSDIVRDDSISLFESGWENKLEKLIKKQIEDKNISFPTIPDTWLNKFYQEIKKERYELCVELLNQIVHRYKILQHNDGLNLMKIIFDIPRFETYSEENKINLLTTINTILDKENNNNSNGFKRYILSRIQSILANSNQAHTHNQKQIVLLTLGILAKTNEDEAVHIFKNFILNTNSERLNDITTSFVWDFKVSNVEFCSRLFDAITEIKLDPNQYPSKKLTIDPLWKSLIGYISQKHSS